MNTTHRVPYVIGVAVDSLGDYEDAWEVAMAAVRHPLGPDSKPQRVWFASHQACAARDGEAITERVPTPGTDAALSFAMALLAAEGSFCVWNASQRDVLRRFFPRNALRPPPWQLVRLIEKETAKRGVRVEQWADASLSTIRRAFLVAEWGARLHSPFAGVEECA